MKKFLIFDFDGVLCNSREVAFEMHNSISNKYNLHQIFSQQDYFNVLDNKLESSFVSQEIKDNYNLEHRNLMLKNINRLTLFNKLVNYLLNKKFEFAIISSTYEKTIKEILLANNLPDNFCNYIYGRETVGAKFTKIKALMENLNLRQDDVIYIGDTNFDVEVCNKLDIPIIFSCYGYSKFSNISSNIIAFASSEDEIINILDKLNKENKMEERFKSSICLVKK